MKNLSTKKIVQTALFVALALVVRMFSVMIPMGGVNGMRIGFSEVFTKMPAILFGPLLGGIASGLVDFLAQVIKSEGAYLWPMLIVMISGGAVTGVMWRLMRGIPARRIRVAFVVLCVGLALFGIYNHFVLASVGSGAWYDTLQRLKENLPMATYGMYGASVLGVAFLVADALIKRRHPDSYKEDFLPLAVTVLVSDIYVTTVNTFVLRYYYSGLSKLPFWVVYVPRLIPDLVSAVIFAYIISCLLKVAKNFNK